MRGAFMKLLPFCLFWFPAAVAMAQTASQTTVKLPEYTVQSPRVALQEPAGAFAMPVTAMRYEPLVDVQARNLAESQADVAIRGGIFENTGFRIGGAALYDPQTGHYFAEIPVAPAMLSAPRVLTGADNALTGFNASVGTVAYDWRRIETRGELSAGAGQDGFQRASLYAGAVSGWRLGGRRLAVDTEIAHSTADGSVPFGDHEFQRYNGRLQLAGEDSQTDLFLGYQSKFFGWPNLYTPFGVNETENLQTTLAVFNHRRDFTGGDYLEIGAYYRRNKDDYEFNRATPGAFNPFQHTTRVHGATLGGRRTIGETALEGEAEFVSDELESTALTFGRFKTRRHYKLGLAAVRAWPVDAARRISARAGAVYEDTDRDGSAVSPLFEIALEETPAGESSRRFFLQYAKSTQAPTYTALNSNPASGLFRGNPDLGRSASHNIELGFAGTQGPWRTHAAVFYRRDDRLVDWTFQSGVTARTANPVDTDTVGAEAVLMWSPADRRWEIVLGYTFLDKQADYGGASVDASFYALNFARHRLTAAVVARLGAGFELRMDNEARIQEDNPLRVTGGNEAVISSLGLFYRPGWLKNIEVSARVDNLWDSDYQEVPAVPAARRQVSAGLAWRW